MLNDGELWLTGEIQNQFTFFFAGFLGVTFFAALLLSYSSRRTSPCVIPLSTPRENDKIEEYIVVVYTSSWPGCTCPPSTSVYANLNGLFHETGSTLLRKQKSNRQIFTRGSVDIFVLQTKEILGDLQNLELELKNSHDDHASNWKPQKFEVYKLDSRERWIADIIPSLKCQKYLKEKVKLSKTPAQIPRWKSVIGNFLSYHYWFFYLSNPESFGIFSNTVRTLLTFFAETSLMFSNIMCYVVYHEPSGEMALSTPDILGSLLALFSSSIVILGIEFALCNIRPTFQKRYVGLPIGSASTDTTDTTERLKDVDVYWEGSNASSSSSDSDIQISGPIAEIRKKKKIIKTKEALEKKEKEKNMAKYKGSYRRNRRQMAQKSIDNAVTDRKYSDNKTKAQPRSPGSFERSRNTSPKLASNLNTSNPRINESCGQRVDHFKKAQDTVSVDLTPVEVKNLWLEGRRSSKRLPGERMAIYTDASDVWDTGSSRTSLLTIDSVQNASYAPQDAPLSICEQGQVTRNETNLNFSSSTNNGSKIPLLDTTRKFASRTWNMISNADIKKWWFEGRKSDKPAEGEHMHIYKTYSEDWETGSNRSTLSEISDVPQHIIESLRPKIDNFDLTQSDSVTYKSESDTSVHLTRIIEMQIGASDDQLLVNKGTNRKVKSYRSTRTAELQTRRLNRRAANEKQNNATQSQSNDDSQIGSSLSTLALQCLMQADPELYASPTEDGDDDDGSVRFIYNTKKKTFFDVLSPPKIPTDSTKNKLSSTDNAEIPTSKNTRSYTDNTEIPTSENKRSSTDNGEIPTSEITSLIRKKFKRVPDSALSNEVTPSTSTEGLMQQSRHKSHTMLRTGFPIIQKFDPDTKPKVIALNVKSRIQASAPKVPTSPAKCRSPASPEFASSTHVTSQGIASVAASEVSSVASQEMVAVTSPPSASSTGPDAASSLSVASVTATETASSPTASSVNMSQVSSVIALVASSVIASADDPVIVSRASSLNASVNDPVIVSRASSVNASVDDHVIVSRASSVNASADDPVIVSIASSVNASVDDHVIVSRASYVNASADDPVIVSIASSVNASVDDPDIMPVASSVNTSAEDHVMESIASSVDASADDSVIVHVASSFNATIDAPGTVSVSSSLHTVPSSPEIAQEITYESNTSLEDFMLEQELERQFQEFFMCLTEDSYSDEALDLFLATKKAMPDILETVSYCKAYTSQSEYSIEHSSASTSSSATTVLENRYRIKDPRMSSSMDLLERIADAISKKMPGSSRSASTVTGSYNLEDDACSELQRLASEASSHTTFSDPYLYRPLYPSDYRITESFMSKCQFSWLTSDIYTDNNFIPTLLHTILLDIDSLMTNDRAWPYLRKKTNRWFLMVCRNLWNQIYAHLLDVDFVIKQDIRLKRIQNRENEEKYSQVVSGSSSSEIDLHTLLSATAVSDESERSEIRCVLLDQALDGCCDCGRTECHQLQNIYSDLLALASAILSQTVASLYKMISQSERISQEALLDLCNAINRCMRITAYDLASVAVEPDLITCYEDQWSLSVDPGYRVIASILVHKSLRLGAAIYDYEWHLGKRAFFLVSDVIDSAVEDIKSEVFEDSVISKLCQDAIKEATQEVLHDFTDPIYIFTQHAVKHKLIHVTKDIVRAKHPLSFMEDPVKKLASVWRQEGLDLSVNITSKLCQALITSIFKAHLKDTRMFSNLAQLREIEQGINGVVRTAILCAINNLLLCIKTGEPINPVKLRSIFEQAADGSNSKVKSKKANNNVSETVEENQNRISNVPNGQTDRISSFPKPPDNMRLSLSIRKIPQVLAEEINFNIDVASAAVYYYLVDQIALIFDEYSFELEISSMVDDIILTARNSLIADELKEIATVEKVEKRNIYPNDDFGPSEMYLKMKSCLISYNVMMDAQMSLIEDSIGDPFTLDSKEIYDLRKELGPLKMYSKFVDQDIQNKNKKEMVKELKKYSKRHRDYVTINLQNLTDSHCISNTTPNYEDRDLYLLEWYLTGQLQRKLSPSFKIPLLVIIFVFTLLCFVFIAMKGAELTIIQCQEWMSLYILTSFLFAFLVTPIKAVCITWFLPVVDPLTQLTNEALE